MKPNPFIELIIEDTYKLSPEFHDKIRENITIKSLEDDLERHIDWIKYRFECGGKANTHDLGYLIQLANAVKWEYENKH